MMRVRGYAPIVRLGPGISQVGVDPSDCYQITGLQDADQRLLESLSGSFSRAAAERAGRCHGLSHSHTRALADALREGGVLRGRDGEAEPPERIIRVWERLCADPAAGWEQLQRWRVVIVCAQRYREQPTTWETLQAYAAGLERALLEMGCPSVICDWGGGVPVHVRKDPFRYAASLCGEPAVDECADPLAQPGTLVLSLHAHVPDRYIMQEMDVRGALHLPVTLRELSMEIGPLLHPSSPLCATCLSLQRQDEDEHWVHRATQARLLPLYEGDGLLSQVGQAAAASAVRQILASCAGWVGAPDWATASLTIAPDLSSHVRGWEAHQQCLCGQVVTQAAAMER